MLHKFTDLMHQRPLKQTEARRLKEQAWTNFSLMRDDLRTYHPALVYEMGRLMMEEAEARLEGIESDQVQA